MANYHDKDVAEAITRLNETERMQLYTMIGTPRLAEIFSYLDDAKPYLDELSLDKAARVISDMDADDALDILDELFLPSNNRKWLPVWMMIPGEM